MVGMQMSIFGFGAATTDTNERLFVAKVVGSEVITSEEVVTDQIEKLDAKLDAVKDELMASTKAMIEEMALDLTEKLAPGAKAQKAKEADERKLKATLARKLKK